MAEAKKKPAKKSAQKVAKEKRQLKLPRFVVILLTPFRGVGRYIVGAWRELRQVRWPNRRATWGLTGAVIAFSLFFAALILGLDFVFRYLFKEILL